MLERAGSTDSQFTTTFPERFEATLDEARGAMAAITASGSSQGGLIPPEALQRLHEVYRLRIELEIETAAVLWRAAEVVCALTDSIESLNRRARPAPMQPRRWLGGVVGGVVESRRSRTGSQGTKGNWPEFGTPLASAPSEGDAAALPGHLSGTRRPGWASGRGGRAAA
jgi:hypothetical protein